MTSSDRAAEMFFEAANCCQLVSALANNRMRGGGDDSALMDSVWVSCTRTFEPCGREIGISGTATIHRVPNRLGLAMKPPHLTYCAITSAPLIFGTVRVMRARFP